MASVATLHCIDSTQVDVGRNTAYISASHLIYTNLISPSYYYQTCSPSPSCYFPNRSPTLDSLSHLIVLELPASLHPFLSGDQGQKKTTTYNSTEIFNPLQWKFFEHKQASSSLYKRVYIHRGSHKWTADVCVSAARWYVFPRSLAPPRGRSAEWRPRTFGAAVEIDEGQPGLEGGDRWAGGPRTGSSPARVALRSNSCWFGVVGRMLAVTWRTNHNRERRMSCTERLRSHFRIPTRTRCAACRTEQRTAAVPRIGHEVAAETAERTSTGSMRPAAQSLAVSALSRWRGKNTEWEVGGGGGEDEENRGKLLQTQESRAKSFTKRK